MHQQLKIRKTVFVLYILSELISYYKVNSDYLTHTG